MSATQRMSQREMISAFQARGCKVTPKAWDSVVNDAVVTTYGVLVSISAMGSTEVQTIRESDEIDPDSIVERMRANLRLRARRTRAAIRAERAES